MQTDKSLNMIYVENHPFVKNADWLENGPIEMSKELYNQFSSCKTQKVTVKEKRSRGRPRLNQKKDMPIFVKRPQPQVKENCGGVEKRGRGRPRKHFQPVKEVSNSPDQNEQKEVMRYEESRPIGPYYEHDLDYDHPKKVLKSLYTNGIKCFVIEWNHRSDGIRPENFPVPSTIIKEKFPEFYHSLDKRFKFN